MNTKGKVIVTGGAGYIGSHTAVALQKAGYTVIICDNLSNSRLEVIDRIARITHQKPIFYQLDITDREALNEMCESHQDAVGVIHFAAYKAVGESVAQPLKYYHNNLGGLISLLETMSYHGLDNLIFSSSCTVYGEPDHLPVTEETPVREAFSPYGNTKQIGEEIIRDTLLAGGMKKALSLRYFNPVGADPSALIGEFPLGVPNNLMPFITQTAIGIRPKLMVFGDDYATPDGTAIRDYIHVSDLAEAHLMALEYVIKNQSPLPYDVFNIGTGRGYSVLEVIQAFERVSGLLLPFEMTVRRAGDVEKVWADTAKAESNLHWKASRSLDEMVASAWKWEQALRQDAERA
jgi:UDP-glucose 4-epimerase